MVDTWATVGSVLKLEKCAYIGRSRNWRSFRTRTSCTSYYWRQLLYRLALHCVEGVRLENEVVLGANVVITGSTKILDVSGKDVVEYKAFVPERSIVIPGNITKKFPAGEFSVPVALIIGKRKESTDKKTSLNDALREHAVSV